MMRWRTNWALAAAALLLVLVATGAQSCGTTTKTSPDTSKSSGKATSRATVGQPITLAGNSGGEKVQVTVVRVLDPVQGGQYDSPSSGNRFVGVQVSIRNVGTATYNDSPSNGAKLITNTNEQAHSTTISEGPCGGNFDSSANVAPGETQQGCIPYEVPTAQAPREFQFTLDSGFGPEAGEWTLR